MKVSGVVAGFAAGIILMLSAYLLAVRGAYPKLEDAAQFGDSFGGLNALFSGLAFAGVVVSLHLQRKELGAQLEEFAALAVEAREQTRILARNYELEKQALADERKRAASDHDLALDWFPGISPVGAAEVWIENVGGPGRNVSVMCNAPGCSRQTFAFWRTHEKRKIVLGPSVGSKDLELTYEHAMGGTFRMVYKIDTSFHEFERTI